MLVGVEMWTVRDVPAAMVPNEHGRLFELIEHIVAPLPPSITHTNPGPTGSGSSSITSSAGAGPSLVTVIVSRGGIRALPSA